MGRSTGVEVEVASESTSRVAPIAVIGMACRFPGADDVEQYWSNLVEGVESVTRKTDDPSQPAGRSDRYVPAVGKVDGVEFFDADYFRIPPAEALLLDPQQRVLLEVSVAALEDAGYAGDSGQTIGVFVGSGVNRYYRDYIAPNPEFQEEFGDVRVTLANEKDFLAPRVAFKLGLTGPSITVQAGCATSLTAVALACEALVAGDCDIALAGGVTLLMPETDGYRYTTGGIFSPDGRCRAFDRLAAGTIPGSGAGIVVLKRDASARADGDNRRAVIRGWGVNNDGGSRAGFTVPNVEGQAAVVRTAIERAGVEPSDVSYVEAHGTGTPIGDPLEVEALNRVFADCPPHSCAIGSVKTNIGHADAAAGVAGLIKATLAAETGIIPASLHFAEPNPEIRFDETPFFVNDATAPWSPSDGRRVAGVSSFALGGMNAHVVLESTAPIEPAAPARPHHLLALSARNEKELGWAKLRLADWLHARPKLTEDALADVAFTLAVGRPRFGSRWAGVFTSPAEAAAALRETDTAVRSISRPSLAVRGTPEELIARGTVVLSEEPLVRSAFAALAAGLLPEGGAPADASLLERLSPSRGGALVAIACARALQELGLTFARIDAPAWVLPAMQWLEHRRPLEQLADVLDACTAGADGAAAGTADGDVAIGPSFRLADEVARAWSFGADVDWATYYGDEGRRRTSLPTYPFTKRKFWLDRVEERPPVSAAANGGAAPDQARVQQTIAESVEEIWCEALGLEQIDHEAHFIDDLGGDSMYAAAIGASLSERFRVELPIDLPFLAPTIATTVSYVERLTRA
jgi:acyl transferase domain-containing protein